MTSPTPPRKDPPPIPATPEEILPLGRVPESGEGFTIRADYFEGQISLKGFRAAHPHYPVLSANPLVLETERGAYAVLTRFGAVVYWQCSSEIIAELRREISNLPGALNRNDAVGDELTVVTGAKQDKVRFEGTLLTELTLEKLKIISEALGKSIALERFEIEVTESMRQFEPVVNDLRSSGAMRFSEKKALKSVGFALNVRSAVLANLTLFESPPEAWESEVLAAIDNQLYDHFDIDERLSAINQKLDYLNDLNSTMMDILNNRKSQRLEWIIIVLIAFEILMALFGGHLGR